MNKMEKVYIEEVLPIMTLIEETLAEKKTDHHNYDPKRDLYVCPHPHQETGYGGFKGGDPREFWPDYECCSAEEVALWRACCDKWNEADAKGITLDPENMQFCRDELGISGNGWKFGIGVYTVEFEQVWESM